MEGRRGLFDGGDFFPSCRRYYDSPPALLSSFRGDFDRCRAVEADDLTAGGEEAVDGGEAASLGSEASNDARALHNALANRKKAGSILPLSSRNASLT